MKSIHRIIIVFQFLSLPFASNCQLKYQLEIQNMTALKIYIKIAEKEVETVNSYSKIIVVDSLPYSKYSIVSINIKCSDSLNDNLFFVTEDSASVILKILGDKNKIRLAYEFLNLPFENDQKMLIDFFQKKDDYMQKERYQYNLKTARNNSKIQIDSLSFLIRTNRKNYLMHIDSIVKFHKEVKAALYIFNSEILNSKSILTLGKDHVYETYKSLNNLLLENTKIGNSIQSYIKKMQTNIIGGYLHDFKFITIDSSHYDFRNYADSNMVLLIFTAKGCKGCVAQVPIIQAIEKEFSSKLKILYISLDRTVEDVKYDLARIDYPGEMTINLPPYNYSLNLKKKFNVEFIPQLFLIDIDKKILYDNLSPYEDDDLKQLKTMLNNSLN